MNLNRRTLALLVTVLLAVAALAAAAQGPEVQKDKPLPDPASLAWLRERHVRYIVVHKSQLENGEGSALLVNLLAEPQLRTLGLYADWAGETVVFELTQ